MKKISLIISILLLVAIALLPVVGNRFMQSYVEKTLGDIDAHGVKLLTLKTNASYLNTTKHFEFLIEDSSKFVKSMQLQSALDGMKVGVDVSYNNVPFAKSIYFALYPLSLSKAMSSELKSEDINFYDKFSKFLQHKGIFYYGEYNLINTKFNSHIKEIHEHYKLHNSSDITFALQGADFKGKGNIFSPKKLITTIKTMRFEAVQNAAHAEFLLKDFHAINQFVSWSNYKNSAAFTKMRFVIAGTKNDLNISVEGLQTASKAVQKEKRIAMESTTSVEHLLLISQAFHIDATKLHSDVSIKDIALKPFEHLSALIKDVPKISMSVNQPLFQEDMLALLSQGVKMQISDIALENVILNKNNRFGGLKLDLDLEVKKDANLQKKMQQSPLLLLTNMELDANIRLSKPIYNLFLQNSPMAKQIAAFAKKENNKVLFNIAFHDGKLQVNGKRLP